LSSFGRFKLPSRGLFFPPLFPCSHYGADSWWSPPKQSDFSRFTPASSVVVPRIHEPFSRVFPLSPLTFLRKRSANLSQRALPANLFPPRSAYFCYPLSCPPFFFPPLFITAREPPRPHEVRRLGIFSFRMVPSPLKPGGSN